MAGKIRRAFPPYPPSHYPLCCVVLFVVLSLVTCICVKSFCSPVVLPCLIFRFKLGVRCTSSARERREEMCFVLRIKPVRRFLSTSVACCAVWYICLPVTLAPLYFHAVPFRPLIFIYFQSFDSFCLKAMPLVLRTVDLFWECLKRFKSSIHWMLSPLSPWSFDGTSMSLVIRRGSHFAHNFHWSWDDSVQFSTKSKKRGVCVSFYHCLTCLDLFLQSAHPLSTKTTNSGLFTRRMPIAGLHCIIAEAERSLGTSSRRYAAPSQK